MSLTTEDEVRRVWGSHLPLLKAYLRIANCESAIECGCGKFSTPVIGAAVDRLTCIEHDVTWAQTMRAELPGVGEWITDSIPLTERRHLQAKELEQVERLYAGYGQRLGPVDFLFIDQTACARALGIIYLAPLTKALIVHDTGPWSCPFYNYDLAWPALVDWYGYELRPEGNVNGHRLEWTRLYTREPASYSALRSIVDLEANELWGHGASLEILA